MIEYIDKLPVVDLDKIKKNKEKDFLDYIPLLKNRRNISSNIIAKNRSYVGRTSRMTVGQQRAYVTGMDMFGYSYTQQYSLSEMSSSIKDKYDALVLDIGFGSGHSLVSMAEARTKELFIGIETYKPGVGSLLVQVLSKHIENIRVFHEDAVSVMFNMVEKNTVDRIQIFFPDPWPKSSHHKRRIIQKRFIQLCSHILKLGGMLWIITDWTEYAESIEKVISECNSSTMINMNSRFIADEKCKIELETQRIITRFEKKGLDKGHNIHSFVFRTQKIRN